MKNILLLAVATVSFVACNNSESKSHDAHTPADTTSVAATNNAVKPSFANVDPAVAASFKSVIDHYLHLKNGLAGDNATEAADAGKAMVAALAAVDKNAMTPEQKTLYTENEEDLREHAEHIGKNAGDIAHQREHFAQMSEDVYALVQGFGGGQPLYHDFCSMYNNDKGGMWLSETADIKNPYFGSKMPTCGTVKEVIQ
ncbi:Protein of unknown function [Chitinophaga jiangningensis]|uniref:DUF3347 domain-containing protein n=1 Tax=Chitinophaga jiangningensis TaxID=1419482 RepID=A0A1M7KJI1_9BACT|nr:DUF3347 domain-containing protein [Chitinophaga jiangningensis]SHM65504.1 Protein of unknown function [Chitinophaga jiangningensis]